MKLRWSRLFIASFVLGLGFIVGCDGGGMGQQDSKSDVAFAGNESATSAEEMQAGVNDGTSPSVSTPDESATPSEDSVAKDDDPILVMLGKIDNEAFKTRYPAIRDAAAKEDATPEELYLHLNVLGAAGGALIQSDERDDALALFSHAYEQAEAVREKLGGEHPEAVKEMVASIYYNGACALAQTGQLTKGTSALGMAVDLGFDDADLLASDTDLDPLRGEAGFAEQMKVWNDKIQAAKSFPFEFELTDLDGNTQSLAAMQGKVVIVDIWGTWCPPCRAEIPHFVKLQETYGEQGLQIIGLNYERTDDVAEATEMINAFRKEQGMNYPCAIGTEEIQAQVPNFRGFPTTVFVGRDGKVADTLVGLHEYEVLEEKVKSLLAQPVADAPESSQESATE